MTTLTSKPVEGSVYIVTINFLDVDGDPFTPLTCTWTLTDLAGSVINARSKVAIAITGVTATVTLSGLDLAYNVGRSAGMRAFTVEGTYNSSYGNSLPFRSEVCFEVLDTIV